MLRIGLTGGIGSGKSTVARIFTTLGIPVYDSDSRAKELMHTAELQAEITGLFGYDAYFGGKLNTQYIASRVFPDRRLLEKLNGVVHPAVMRDFESWVESKAGCRYPYVVQENAILFDHGFDKAMDMTLTISAPAEERIQRASMRDGRDPEDVRKRICNQMTDAQRETLANYVIHNGEHELIVPHIIKLHEEFCRLGKKNATE